MAFKAAMPNARMETLRAVEDGNEVFVGGLFRGTHTGDMLTPQGSIPASGNELALPFADYLRVDNGKIVEQNVVFDQLTMLTQWGGAELGGPAGRGRPTGQRGAGWPARAAGRVPGVCPRAWPVPALSGWRGPRE